MDRYTSTSFIWIDTRQWQIQRMINFVSCSCAPRTVKSLVYIKSFLYTLINIVHCRTHKHRYNNIQHTSIFLIFEYHSHTSCMHAFVQVEIEVILHDISKEFCMCDVCAERKSVLWLHSLLLRFTCVAFLSLPLCFWICFCWSGTRVPLHYFLSLSFTRSLTRSLSMYVCRCVCRCVCTCCIDLLSAESNSVRALAFGCLPR